MTAHVEDDFIHSGRQGASRSSSAPPTRKPTGSGTGEGACDTTAFHASCGASRTDSSTEASVVGEASPRSSSGGRGTSPPSVADESDTDCSELAVHGDNENEGLRRQHAAAAQVPSAPAEHQIEQMSQMVMDIWAKLRLVESSLGEAAPAAAEPAGAAEPVARPPAEPGLAGPGGAPAGAAVAVAPAPGGAARAFPPCCARAREVQHVLASVREMLATAPSVASVAIDFGRPGALASISVRLDPRAFAWRLDETIVVSKSALLEAAANSQSVYVLGYDADPFQNASRSVFTLTLATIPNEWECSPCWETYQSGYCTRGKRCRRRHPGRNDLQPVRVVVS